MICIAWSVFGLLLQGCCCKAVAARLLLQGCCCTAVAARLLLQGCCCKAVAARLLLQGCCCKGVGVDWHPLLYGLIPKLWLYDMISAVFFLFLLSSYTFTKSCGSTGDPQDIATGGRKYLFLASGPSLSMSMYSISRHEITPERFLRDFNCSG